MGIGRPFTNNGGSGTADSPNEIATLEQLEAFRDYINAGATGGEGEYFKLTASIDMSAKYSVGSGTSWTPIGTSDKAPFNSTFDGGGFEISGLYINTEDAYQGLFGYSTGTIKNLTVSGSITGGIDTGGIVGYNAGGRVENCCNTNAVNGGSSVSGIVGYNNGGSIENCYNAGAVTGTGNKIGGIAGSNSGSVKNSYNTGTVSGNGWVGGIVGSSDGSVRYCYYLNTCGAKGTYGGTSKTAAQFASGEVAWLLQNKQDTPDQQVWGQKLSGEVDAYPVLTTDTSKKVLKVTFAMRDNSNYDVKYTNPNGTVTLPENP